MNRNSFWGHAIITTKADLVRAIGPPTDTGIAKERTRNEWSLYSGMAGAFSIYDLRSRDYYDHEEQEFRIAAKDAEASEICYLEVVTALSRANAPK